MNISILLASIATVIVHVTRAWAQLLYIMLLFRRPDRRNGSKRIVSYASH